jgi:phosphoglycolate phosphatase
MLKAVVFDLDGTLTVLTLPLEAMRKDTKEYYYTRGLPPGVFDQSDGISSSTMKAKSYFLSRGTTLSNWERMEAEVDMMLSEYEGSVAGEVRVIEGALETVRAVRARGLKTAILTNNGRLAVDIMLKIIPLEHLFEIIQTRNESPTPKPFPDGLRTIVKNLGVRSDQVVYVGDASIDGAAASRAGIEFWGVTTGETDRETLLYAGAKVVVSSLNGILPLVDSRLSKRGS